MKRFALILLLLVAATVHGAPPEAIGNFKLTLGPANGVVAYNSTNDALENVTLSGLTLTGTTALTLTSTGGSVTPPLVLTLTGLGTATSPALQVTNTTAAGAGAQQVSPSIRRTGQGWKTNATAGSQTVEFRDYVLPVQGTANPDANWLLQSSINGGAWANQVTIRTASSGEFDYYGKLFSPFDIYAFQFANGDDIYKAIRFTDTSPTGNFLRLRNAGDTSDVFAVGIDGTLNVGIVPVARVTGLAASATTDTTNAANISSGTLPAGRLPALTGDVTTSSGSAATTVVNLPDGVTQAGSLVITDIAVPTSPAAAHLKIFGDSTDLRFHDKNAAGTIGTTVVADTGASNNFLTSISAAGVIGKAQPTDANLSLSDITTNNVSTTAHGFVAKLPNDATKYLDGTGVFTTPASGWVFVPLASDLTTTSLTFVDATGLSFSVSASKQYAVQMHLATNKSTGSAGMKIQFTGPASPTLVNLRATFITSSAINGGNEVLTAFSSGSTTFTTYAGDGAYDTTGGTIANGANAGTVQLQFEAVTGATAKIYAGSYIMYKQLN